MPNKGSLLYAMLAIALGMLFFIAQLARETKEIVHDSTKRESSTLTYRAEWDDSSGVHRVVETIQRTAETDEAVLHRHRAEIELLSKEFPPR
jgi:hypothetical protein